MKLGSGESELPVENLNTEQQGRLKKAVKDATDSHVRIDAEQEYTREVIKKIADDLKIPKKLVARLVKAHHKQNFEDEKVENEQFEKLYRSLMG